MDLDGWLKRWPELNEPRRQAIIGAVGALAHTLHQAGQMHGCFYPKHIFLREQDGHWQACLIDLEKPVLCCWGGATGSRIWNLSCGVQAASVSKVCGTC